MSLYNLSASEGEIMQYIWDQNRVVTFREVMANTQSQGHDWKKQTVKTFLTRLIGKGALQMEKKGNKAYYTPVMTEKEYASRWTRKILDDGFDSSLKRFLAAYIGEGALSAEEAQELRVFLGGGENGGSQ